MANAKPTVCCVMLANGREAMVRRAINSFRMLERANAFLWIWDTSPYQDFSAPLQYAGLGECIAVLERGPSTSTIGTLRNEAIEAAQSKGSKPDIIVHWDSDDWSHPNRIAEQVELLQTSGKDSVGYRDMLFWRETHREIAGLVAMTSNAPGEAWLYSNQDPRYCLGTSLCYWRSVWEKHPFPDLPRPGATDNAHEDNVWLRGVQSQGISSVTQQEYEEPGPRLGGDALEPRMICSIHGNNSSDYGMHILGASPQWKRVPEWDQHCREVMAL